MSYEEGQKHLQRLWDSLLSDESDFSPNASEYEPTEESSSSDDEPTTPIKKRKLFSDGSKVRKLNLGQCNQNGDNAPSTSSNIVQELETEVVAPPPASNIDDIIEEVIRQSSYNNVEEIDSPNEELK